MNFFMWRHVSNPKNNLSEGISQNEKRIYPLRAAIFPLFFIATAIVYLIVPKFAIIMAPILGLAVRVFRKFFISGKQKKEVLK